MPTTSERIPILYLAPWIDFGGTDKNTIDWFRHIDRERFAPSLIATQPSPNRRLVEIVDHAEEIWVLPDLMTAEHMPRFILDFVASRDIQVVHLMNSRLGFDLLPDMTCLPSPPAVVVQLHVEEPDRSGYVRYVTTRYGNLVDRFSIASKHLAVAVQDYGVSADRTKVIYIGVDAAEEFAPQRVKPVEGLAANKFHVAFPARLVDQKDPLLMVEVSATLRDLGVDFQIHVLGEGPLEQETRERIKAHRLEEQVLLHPPTSTPERWYAACDALLLTSVFEGVPAVVYEAMAMELPVVASALPGNAELLSGDRGEAALIEPREDVNGYAEALARLARDPSYGRSVGSELRARALEKFSLQQMAKEHERLYEEVLAERAVPEGKSRGEAERPAPIRFRDRPLEGTPLVSVVVPHYNQSNVLPECVDSIWSQTYPEVELIVVDDASTERDASEVLDVLEAHDDLVLLRLESNGGPSRARNRAIEASSGRYVLPVDADNILEPDAIERLVEQLSTAGEDIGFIYPSLQYFGNREDYFGAPEYNGYRLLFGNFCDTCSLLDRQIFDAGEYFSEDIHLGHEDWEFFVRLADRDVRGEAAHGPMVRYRKWGFNRSDSVEHLPEPFEDQLAATSTIEARRAEVKAAEMPALSLGCLRGPRDAATSTELSEMLATQSCPDIELISPWDNFAPDTDGASAIHPVPNALATTPTETLDQIRLRMRGSFHALTSGDGTSLLADPAFSAKVLRRFATNRDLDAIAFADAGDGGKIAFQPLPAGAKDTDPEPRAHTIIWRVAAESNLPRGLHADPADPVHSIALLLNGNGALVDWHHARRPKPSEGRELAGTWLPVASPWRRSPEDLPHLTEPLLPGEGKYRVPRWEREGTWTPALTKQVVRYRDPHTNRRIATGGPEPRGWLPEYRLGSIPTSSLQGTERLLRVGDEYRTEPLGEWRPVPENCEEIGYIEKAPLPLWKALAVAVHRLSGEEILVQLPDDPLLAEVDVTRALGFIEPAPLEPSEMTDTRRPLGLVGLVTSMDPVARRHRCAIGAVPAGEFTRELGGLASSDLQGSVPAWVEDGMLVTDRHHPPIIRPRLKTAARWVMEPAAWPGLVERKALVKLGLRRGVMAAQSRLSSASRQPRPAAPADPEGWLYESDRPGLAPLFAAYHPVTGDQLLARSPADASHLGYGHPALLGFMRLTASPVAATERRPPPVPWARRFGEVPRAL